MKPIGSFEKMNNFFQLFPPLVSPYKISVYSSKNSHHAKTTSAACHDHLIMLRIIIVLVNAFSSHSTNRFRSIKEILKGLFFDHIEQSRIRYGFWRRIRRKLLFPVSKRR